MPFRRQVAVARAVTGTALRQLTRRGSAVVPGAPEPPRSLAHPFAASIETSARPDQVFAVLSDPARMADWLVIHTGWPEEPPERFATGLRLRQRIKVMGTPTEVRWTVTGVDEPRTLWLDGEGPMGIVVGLYLSVVASATGATVYCAGGVEGGPTNGPLGPMVARNLGDALHKSLGRLAEVAPEAAPPDRVRTKPATIRHDRTGQDVDPWTPVIVGVGQLTEHGTDPQGGDPVALAVRALRAAAEDSGAAGLLRTADSVGWVASVSWQYADGAAMIAEAVGARPAETVQTGLFGGDGPLRLINDTAARIAAGDITVALLGGGEAAATAAAAERAGQALRWPQQPDGTAPTRVLDADREPNNDPETAAGLIAPIYQYALLESAMRRRSGLAKAEHEDRMTRLWARFSEVAAGNPYAWRPQRRGPAELTRPEGGNRPVAAPYRKLLTADFEVNQATGVIMCSAEAARDAGIPQDRWVFAHAGAHATDEWFVTDRADLASSPAIRACGAAALRQAGLAIEDIRHIDLYACFPSAVQLAAAELGLPVDEPDRPLTVTGGLTFAGGPGNNYASHAVANLVSRLRADPDGAGLVTALGWYSTKHALGVFSGRPPAHAYRDIDAGLRLVRPAARTARLSRSGPAVLEAYTVTYRRDGEPEAGIITAIMPDGDRVVHRTTDRDLIDRLLAEDPLGWRLDGTTVVDTAPAPLPPAGEAAVLVTWHGPVTVIRLHRLAVHHAADTTERLQRALDDFDADPDAAVAVLTGTGPAAPAKTLTAPTKPLIAAVEGGAGCELALTADLIVAAEDAVFGFPDPRTALAGEAGGFRRLARALPGTVALDLALTGEPMSARRLYDLGLVTRIAPPGTAFDTALGLAQAIAGQDAIAVRAAKRIVGDHHATTPTEALDHLATIAAQVNGTGTVDVRGRGRS